MHISAHAVILKSSDENGYNGQKVGRREAVLLVDLARPDQRGQIKVRANDIDGHCSRVGDICGNRFQIAGSLSRGRSGGTILAIVHVARASGAEFSLTEGAVGLRRWWQSCSRASQSHGGKWH